jgi:cold shock CspA family protein
MLAGTIKIWMPEKDSGFIRPRNRHDADVVFFARHIPEGRTPVKGEPVEYTVLRRHSRSADLAGRVVMK